MCGIAGIVQLDGAPVAQPVLRRMTDALAHRGPDGDGFYVDKAVGLGHRRLAIIDLTPAGRQPMISHDGRLVISYNGEIYNFQELRAELQALGHRFQSRTDTEVALNAWLQWGPGALERFNGMFALAVWDHERQELALARDRYGVKPLYFASRGATFAFGSEVKALLAHPRFTAALDQYGLLEYLTFQNFFSSRTLFKDIELLPAGCFATVSRSSGRVTVHRYWDFHFAEPERRLPPEEYEEELARLFSQAVNRQLVSDVDVGAYLSGGIDSGLICAVAAASLPGMRSFTVGFDLSSASGLEAGMDERSEAEHMSYLFKTEHYEMVLKAGDMERVMPRMIRHLEEPRVGQSYPNFYAAQLAGKFGKVVLAGTGGDELFGGYPWRYFRAGTDTGFDAFVDQYYLYWQRLVPEGRIGDVLAPIWSDVKHVDTRDIFRRVFSGRERDLHRPEDSINHSLYFEARTFLHGLLVVEDKLSMAHGLETRVPFLDNDLVAFATRLPVSLKLGNLATVDRVDENELGDKQQHFFSRTRDGKLLLRKVMQRYVPSNVTRREKKGFSAPDASWFRGESIDFVKRTIFDDGAEIWQYLDRDVTRDLVRDHLEGRENRRLLIWSLLSLEEWCRTFRTSTGLQY